MDNNQDPSVAVPPDGHPPLFRPSVLLVKDERGQGIQKKLGPKDLGAQARPGFGPRLQRRVNPFLCLAPS